MKPKENQRDSSSVSTSNKRGDSCKNYAKEAHEKQVLGYDASKKKLKLLPQSLMTLAKSFENTYWHHPAPAKIPTQ